MKCSAALLSPGLAMVLASAVSITSADAQESKHVVFTFDKPDVEPWTAVNDGVMGGVSDGGARITERGTMEFYGSISLENNGGFASIRSRRADLDLSDFDGLLIRVRGDGKRYDLNVRTNIRIIAGSYRAKFNTAADAWQEIYVPFADFEPTSFGRVRKDLPALDPRKIRSLGFLISDKQVGPFALEVEWIKAIVSRDGANVQTANAARSDRYSAIQHWIGAVIQRGAPLYNAGEPRLCAQMYMLTVSSLVRMPAGDLPPYVIERLAAALRDAEEAVAATEQAWILRRALDFTLESLENRIT